MRGGPNLSEIAGAGSRLSQKGLHETGDETVRLGAADRNQEIGLNLVVGSSAQTARGRTGIGASLEGAGRGLLPGPRSFVRH
jgi:hypothetical protein